jgi:hypothetical protein
LELEQLIEPAHHSCRFEIPFPIHSAAIQEEVYVSEAAAEEVVPLTTGSLEEVEVTSAAKVEDPIGERLRWRDFPMALADLFTIG